MRERTELHALREASSESSSSSSSSSGSGSTRNSSRSGSVFDDGGSGESFSQQHQPGSSSLAATITSIRTNVTRVLNMYFQNVTVSEIASDEAEADDEHRVLQDRQPEQQLHDFANVATTTTATTTATTTSAAIRGTAVAAIKQHIANFFNFTTKAAAAATTTTATTAALLPASLTNATAKATAALPPPPSPSLNLMTEIALHATPSAVTPSQPHAFAPPVITYPSFREAIRSFDNCSALFANYTKPQQGLFCNWTWDSFLCWPPTPAGALARMHCPAGLHGIDTRKYAARNCQLDGRWSGRPNETYNPVGWTNYTQCYKPEVTNLLQQIKDQDVIYAIAVRTRTMEIVGLVLSLCALILSLIIFFNFRTLRNNRTKIHKNLFIAMVAQVIIRLTLYLDQAITRGGEQTASNNSVHGIDNTPYLCEASYVLLEYARTAMFMWMFIEGLYLHNVVTVKVFQGRFPHTVYSTIGWGVPVLMTAVWAVVTATKMEYSENEPCWWNYNLTVYYWILEGPRLLVMMVNFIFLLNIIRVLVVKLRQSQASDVEQARKAVRAAVVLLPLLGVTNLLYIMPPLGRPAWVFGVWAYLTYFLSSFQGFFIALIYCFLNGEVRAALLKSITVYMSVRGHTDWMPRRTSMFSGAYHTAPDTEAHATTHEARRMDSSPNNGRSNGRLSSHLLLQRSDTHHHHHQPSKQTRIAAAGSSAERLRLTGNKSNSLSGTSNNSGGGGHWVLSLCFRGQKVLRVPPAPPVPPESVVFELSEQ